jgi:hypothetical protein
VEDENYFHKLNDAYAKHYSPTEDSAEFDEISVLLFSNSIY